MSTILVPGLEPNCTLNYFLVTKVLTKAGEVIAESEWKDKIVYLNETKYLVI